MGSQCRGLEVETTKYQVTERRNLTMRYTAGLTKGFWLKWDNLRKSSVLLRCWPKNRWRRKRSGLVVDFRELNRFVRRHSGDSAVCDHTMRKWRWRYLQLHMDRELWKYLVFEFRVQLFYLFVRKSSNWCLKWWQNNY